MNIFSKASAQDGNFELKTKRNKATAKRKAKAPARRRWSAKATNWGFAFFAPLALFLWAFVYANMNSVAGMAGWMSGDAPQMELSCDGKTVWYTASLKGVFVNRDDMPCGSVVKVTNLDNFKSVRARVVHTDMVRSDYHIADVTYATALDLGIDPEAEGQARLALTPLDTKKLRAAAMMSVIVRQNIPPAPTFTAEDERAMTQLILTEVQHLVNKKDKYQREGVYGVALVAMNRARVHFRGKETVHDVIYDGKGKDTSCQFSGFCDGLADPDESHSLYALSNKMGREVLSDNLAGKRRWMTVLLRNSLHFFGPLAMKGKLPYWASAYNKVNAIPSGWEHWFLETKEGSTERARLEAVRFQNIVKALPRRKPANEVKLAQQKLVKGCTDVDCILARVNAE